MSGGLTRVVRMVGVVASGVLTGMVAAGCGDDPDPAPAASIARGDVVAVEAQPCDRPNARLGVGTSLGDGRVLTAAHTVDGALRRLTVDGSDADVVAIDVERDLALLTADGTGSVADSSSGPVDIVDAEIGDRLAVVVAPTETVDVTVDRTVRLVVDDVTDDRRSERRSHVIRPGLPPGSSGAPVLDGAGRLVGVVALTARRVDESFVVAGDEISSFLDHGASPVETESDGSFTVGVCE